ncbi:disease resistance protein RGA2-like [Gossypium arboreum]|uniref:disease resistance protein RGA2-like n=1 Tax=Gossypium arboreum TaxID=29729 RepID=UPI0022F19D29|nr:disease resistance protein RGA2-like [Gossypium arboreum]
MAETLLRYCEKDAINHLNTNSSKVRLLRQYSDNRHVFRRETISFVDSSDVIGRNEDKENIISMLMKPSEDRNAPVIPIVGLGGLGKTTLAQLSVNEEVKCDALTLEALQARLRSLFNDKKFLLVSDNVWNENQAKWVELRNLLRSIDGLSQRKTILTTRSLKVASIMSSICPYELKGLPLEDCLTLFIKWAFNDDERHYPNLIRIGEEIVKKCKGVSLVVRTLGSILFQKTNESDWIFIRESEMWRLEQDENDILSGLKLSYNHLPSHLQRCLAFLSLYKKDEIYLSDKIIHLWMANGLLEHPKQNQEWEDVRK